ncbi:TPA: restriction endonuclease subunit S [Vibrio cholerae]
MSALEQEIPKGYLKTEHGIFPSDWSVLTLDDVCSFVGGAQPEKSVFSYKEQSGYIRLIQIRDYKSDKDIVYIPEKLARKKCSTIDIMIGRYGPPIFQILRGIEGAYNVALIKATPKENIEREFLYYFLKNDSLFELMDMLSQRSSGQTGVELPALKSYPIGLPPKKEQTAIANALSDVDALISELEKLIAKKQAIKTATMQQLLTGRTRLPQFALRDDGSPKGTKPSELGDVPEDWEVVEFGHTLKEFRNGYAFSANGYSSTGTPIITMAQIGLSGSFQFDISKVNKWDSEQQDSLKEFWVRDGDLLIAMTDVTPDKNLIGQMTIAKLGGIALLNQRVGLLRLKNEIAYTGYFSFLSCLPIWKTYCKGVASLGVQANIGTSDIRKAKVPLPSIKEQTAIATILSDMDTEIQALEQRLGKTRQIKQGMMQELLTGKTRLIQGSEAR